MGSHSASRGSSAITNYCQVIGVVTAQGDAGSSMNLHLVPVSAGIVTEGGPGIRTLRLVELIPDSNAIVYAVSHR